MPVEDESRGDRKYTLQKAVDFIKENQAWKIPYKNTAHDHTKTKIENIIDRDMHCRLIETDAEFITNIIGDILKDRRRYWIDPESRGIDPSMGPIWLIHFLEEDYNGYLNEPVVRSHMRFKSYGGFPYFDEMKDKTKLHVYVRTHVKNPYMSQNLISVNSDGLYDSTINAIRPTLPALFISEVGELCYIDMFLAKAKKKLPKPNEMMGYYSLLDLEGNVIIPQEVICNYSFRKQTLPGIFDVTYFFIHTHENKQYCLMTNSNLMPLYNIDFSSRTVDGITVTPKITGGGQLTHPDYWYDPHLRNDLHVFSTPQIRYVGKLYPEFNEDATSYNYDYLELIKERRIYDLQSDTKTPGELFKIINNTDKMEDTKVTVCQETTTGIYADTIQEYKYPKLNKIYYYDGQRAFRYDPASQTDEALLQVATLISTGTYLEPETIDYYNIVDNDYYGSYRNYDDEDKDNWIGVEGKYFLYPVGDLPVKWGRYKVKKIRVTAAASAGDLISQSELEELNESIMTIEITYETKQYQYLVKKGIFVEENADGEKEYVKYDVDVIIAPKEKKVYQSKLIGGSYKSETYVKFKIKRYTGIDFKTLVRSDIIELKTSSTKRTITKYENTKTHFRFLYYDENYTEYTSDFKQRSNEFSTYSQVFKVYSPIKDYITIRKTIARGTIFDRDEWDYPGDTWKYSFAYPDEDETEAKELTFDDVEIKNNFTFFIPLYYFTQELTNLGNTYNQSNILAQSTINKLFGTSKAFVNCYLDPISNSDYDYTYEQVRPRIEYDEEVITGGPFSSSSKIFSHGALNSDKSFYTFKQQPCYDRKISELDPDYYDHESMPEPFEMGDEYVYEPGLKDYLSKYHKLKGSIHSCEKLFTVEQEESDFIDENDKEKKPILHKKIITTPNWDFSLEPPKSLIHPTPTQFTIIGPYYNSPIQAASYKEFTETQTEFIMRYPGDEFGYQDIVNEIIETKTEAHMMIYYVPSDPILNEEDVTSIGSEKFLNFHFKGINRDLGLSNKERFKVLIENSNFSGSIDLISDKEGESVIFPTSRKLKFSTKANFGAFRLKIKDDLEIIKNPKTKEAALRVDQSPLIKIWPRTLPIKYQMNTDGIFQKVSSWKLGFLPAPKSNYHLRFFRKEEPDTQINLDEPFDPQYGIMKIKKVESSKTGDNDLEELSMEVSFWNISYDGKPYIPKTLGKNSTIVVEFNGVGSYPYHWFVVNTDKTYNVAILLPYTEKKIIDKEEKEVIDKKKQKLVTLNETGKFRLCVTDGSTIFYTSSEIEIK